MQRIVDITSRGASIRLALNAIQVYENDALIARIPTRDIEALLLSETAISISGAVISALSEAGVLVIFCDPRHRPISIVQPLVSKNNQAQILIRQLNISMPIKKRLWQQLISEKIMRQRIILEQLGMSVESMDEMIHSVRSGDPENIEGMAARIYWRRLNLFPKRDRAANDSNRLFNYAYMVLFSIVGRAICATGLNPSLGLHHSNGRNPFCLVCDFMEPFRIIADHSVLLWLQTNPTSTEVSSAAKGFIVNKMLSSKLECDGKSLAILDALYHSAVSLRESIVNNKIQLIIPKYQISESLQCG